MQKIVHFSPMQQTPSFIDITPILLSTEVMSEKVCKILLVLSPMLGFPKHGGNL